jgi:hypothetical protein
MEYALETSLKITLMRAIGLNCLISSAPGTLGIKDKIPKFKREMSIRPRAKPLSFGELKASQGSRRI